MTCDEVGIDLGTTNSVVFSTFDDNQPSFKVQVFQGEREMAADNKKLGEFELTGLPPAPRGVVQVEVTFDIDANGIVQVSAKNLGTGKGQSVTITGGSALPRDEINRMVREAEEDRRRREEAEIRDQGESLVYSTARFLVENREKIDMAVKIDVEEKRGAWRAAVAGTDVWAIRATGEALGEAVARMLQRFYETDTAADGDVVDAPT